LDDEGLEEGVTDLSGDVEEESYYADDFEDDSEAEASNESCDLRWVLVM